MSSPSSFLSVEDRPLMADESKEIANSRNRERNFWIWNFVANTCLSQFKSVKNCPVSRLHDCHTKTFCILYCAPCYDYGFNNKRCWPKNFAKYLYIERNRLWLCTPNSRSHQSSVKEVAEIAMVVLVAGEKHPRLRNGFLPWNNFTTHFVFL